VEVVIAHHKVLSQHFAGVTEKYYGKHSYVSCLQAKIKHGTSQTQSRGVNLCDVLSAQKFENKIVLSGGPCASTIMEFAYIVNS
jgi:hypothetical protein